MQIDLQSDKPIFVQIAEQIEDSILSGVFAEEEQVPSTTDLSTRFGINPATVLKGMNVLVDAGLLYKQRGRGMFVKQGAAQLIRQKKRREFEQNYLEHVVAEAKILGFSKEELISMIENIYGRWSS